MGKTILSPVAASPGHGSALQLPLSVGDLQLVERLRTTFDTSVEAIATAVETRDGYTESHCRRLALFSAIMAARLGLDAREIEAIRVGALLHDVGKLGVRDELLLKGRGGRFDPSLVDLFLEILEEEGEEMLALVDSHLAISPSPGVTARFSTRIGG